MQAYFTRSFRLYLEHGILFQVICIVHGVFEFAANSNSFYRYTAILLIIAVKWCSGIKMENRQGESRLCLSPVSLAYVSLLSLSPMSLSYLSRLYLSPMSLAVFLPYVFPCLSPRCLFLRQTEEKHGAERQGRNMG